MHCNLWLHRLSQISLAIMAVFAVAPVLGEEQPLDPVGANEMSIPRPAAQENNNQTTNNPSSSEDDAIHIRAEQMTGRPERILNLDGKVNIVRGTSTINSNTAEYHAVDDLVMANGNVQMTRNKDCYSGDTLQLQMDTGQGYLSNPVYQLEKNNARGFAKNVNFIDENRSEVEQGIYTTCAGTQPDWYLKSSRLNLDADRDEGVALGGVVYFKEVPILAAPWISFPISGARRSGFLPPAYNSTTAGGIELMVPYYFDIAPNRDATFYPNYITKRGIQLGGEFRYLEPNYAGKIFAEVTPNDEITEATRYSLSYLHNQTLLPGLNMNWNYNRASDDQYAIDYSHSVTESSQHLLPQTFSLIYAQTWGKVGLLTSNYQVLQDANNTIVKPYEILPKVFGQVAGYDELGGFDWSLGTEYTNFLSAIPGQVNGKRLAVNAQVSYPITGTYYFVIPKAIYHLSSYHLNDNVAPGAPTDPSLSVPTFSLDSGLFFERDTQLFGRDVTQTLEPRLFYVKTPYRNQTDIPLFDTGIKDLNFAQIFSENRFAGEDRVGDANQLTAGLMSRFIEMDGQERIRLGVAQRYSFSQPRVVDNPFFVVNQMQNGQTVSEVVPNIPNKSDLIFAANGKLTNTLSANAVWQYNQSEHNTGRMSYGFRWQPAPMKVINAEYRFQEVSEVNPDVMRQVDVSVQWPLAKRWYGVARANYSVVDQRLLDGLVGLEYQQDCWIFRVVAQRYQIPSTVADVTSSSNTSLFLQLELNGLSKIGTNPLEVLRRSIPGYQPIGQPTTQR